MAQAAEAHYADAIAAGRFIGLAVTRKGYGLPLSAFELMEAAHPVPDGTSAAAADRALRLAGDAARGRSAAGADLGWRLGALGRAFAGHQSCGEAGADAQSACVPARRSAKSIACASTCRASRADGWRAPPAPARIVTLAISDVPGDAPDTIGSGPTVADATTLAQARAVLVRYGLSPAPAILAALGDASERNPQAGRSGLRRRAIRPGGRPTGRACGPPPRRLPVMDTSRSCWATRIEGEAREVAAEHARLALDAHGMAGASPSFRAAS